MSVSTKASEDYLKIIYKLEEVALSDSDKGVATSEIAKRLDVSKASVSNMIKKLAEHGWVRYEPYYGVTLTTAGRSIALNMIRRHRILELYLVEKLGYAWDEVDEEAEVLEHAVSDKLVQRMWQEMGCPDRDPHGSPIPDERGKMQDDLLISLLQVPLKVPHEVLRIKNRRPEELRYLASIGLQQNVWVSVLNVAPFDGPVTIEINQTQRVLDNRIAASIMVSKAKESGFAKEAE